jgi:hypothetical protein
VHTSCLINLTKRSMKEEEYLGVADFGNWSQSNSNFPYKTSTLFRVIIVGSSPKQNDLSNKTLVASTRDYETNIVWAPATGTTMVAWREGYGKGEERKTAVSVGEKSCTGQLRTSDEWMFSYVPMWFPIIHRHYYCQRTSCVCPHTCLVKPKIIYACLLS